MPATGASKESFQTVASTSYSVLGSSWPSGTGAPAVLFFASLVFYLHWWLHGRLLCLGGEKCLIGMVRSLSPADPLEKGGDDDFSINVSST